ncbi:hypothetical protein SKAU_G00283620 [Synaphobranchus kaupii]|uniref:Uncharacterized protein n=1 Tax=Synaphobranchus kaupii TaxID=118154 RepID=A0A9Q1INX3_SYNKA|nr:hypothetical protein SKAU_G00283620 [Synaphobranchus kaupii]
MLSGSQSSLFPHEEKETLSSGGQPPVRCGQVTCCSSRAPQLQSPLLELHSQLVGRQLFQCTSSAIYMQGAKKHQAISNKGSCPAAVRQGPCPAGGTGFAFPWFMCAPWVPKFSGEEGTMKFVKWKTQVQGYAQGTGTDRRTTSGLFAGGCRCFVEGARRTVWAANTAAGAEAPLFDYQLDLCELYSRWRKQEPGGEEVDDTLLHDQFLLGLHDGPIKQELQRHISTLSSIAGTRGGGPFAMNVEKWDAKRIPVHSEVIHWAQVSNGSLTEGHSGLVEGVEDGGEWKVARGLVRVLGGQVLLWIINVHPFPIELPRRRPLVTIARIDPSQVQGGRNMVLQTPSPREVVVDVRTAQTPARVGSPLDLLEAEGLTPD